MLNFPIKSSVPEDTKKYPIYFIHSNQCVACGNGHIQFLDTSNRFMRSNITGIKCGQCDTCGKLYSIEWVWSDEKDNYLPQFHTYNKNIVYNKFIQNREE